MSKFKVVVVAADLQSGYDEVVEARTAQSAENKVKRALGREWRDATYTTTEVTE